VDGFVKYKSPLFAYALAKVRGVPLLFKGDDFTHTDIQSAAMVFPTG